jgi:hypothetical protein
MTFIRKLALALCLAGSFSFSNAQQVDSTGNLVTNVRGTSGHDVWLGTGGSADLGGVHPINVWGCCTSYSGASPILDTSTLNGNGDSGQIIWSYGQSTANYIVNTANALAGVGSTGLQIHGYTWGYDLRNMNGDDRQGSIDTLIATSRLWNSTYTGGGLASQTRTHNTKMEWTRFDGTVTLSSPQPLSNVGNLQLSFTSSDSGFWGGYYGPQIRDVRASLLYSIDPCALNPLYASHCAGFNDIVTSLNLVPNPAAEAYWGQSMNQTFAIATALQHGGLGVQVHGFNWGFDAYVDNTYYAGAFWTDFRDPNLYTTATIRDSAGNSIYTVSNKGVYDDSPYWQTYNYSYLLPQSRNSLTLGNFEFTAQTVDSAYISNVYVTAMYTPDQCVLNPLYSTSCTGYAQAIYDQQCSANPLYDSGCPGYAQAFYDQQCSYDALYDSGCPGYETAYFNYQCGLSPLYNNACPGYAQAFFDQQCGFSALYNTQCPGYAEAKILKDLQEQMATQSEPTAETATTSITGAPSTTASSATVALADPTRTETVVTTDVGGVELTTSGEISIPTGEPTATKEAIKEAAKEEEKKQEEKKADGEKKRVDPRALAVARAAAREAEATALSTAESAVAFSQSDVATSSALGLGTGITIGGFRPLGVGEGTEEENKAAQTTSTNKDTNLNAQNNSAAQGQQQDVAQKTGPAVRNGGRVEGMEGGPDPAQLARAPMDFNQYLNSQLKDAQFYASKDIYKGQRNVDNQRLLRGLTGGSDRLHEQMINQQYNITGQ